MVGPINQLFNETKELDTSEKSRMVHFLLLEAEKILREIDTARESLFLYSLRKILEISPTPEILCTVAALHFRWGWMSQNEDYLWCALDKFQQAFSESRHYLENNPKWFHVWGKVFLSLYDFSPKDFLIDEALVQFAKCEKFLIDEHEIQEKQSLYWDWGNAFVKKGKDSNEPLEFQKALEKFGSAFQFGCRLPQFRVDFAVAYFSLGQIVSNPLYFQKALDEVQEALAISNAQPIPLQKKAWKLAACSAQKIADMTGEKQDFRKADLLFQEAILATPSQSVLWLHWAELCIDRAWLYKDVSALEDALEKLSSSRASENDPFILNLLFAESLIWLGFFLDEFRFIKLGKKRVDECIKLREKDPRTLYIRGLVELVNGLYFSEDSFFANSEEFFLKALSILPNFKFYQGLFQVYLSWGFSQKNSWILKKAVKIMEKLKELRPYSPYVFYQLAISMYRLHLIEKKQDSSLLFDALFNLNKAIELSGGIAQHEWLFHLACIHLELGRYDLDHVNKAVWILEDLHEKVPDSISIEHQLALALSFLGEQTKNLNFLYKSLEHFENVKQTKENAENFLSEWGYALLVLSELLDDSEQAEKNRLKSLAEEKFVVSTFYGNPSAYYYLACIYSLSGLYDQALKALKKFFLENSGVTDLDLENEKWLESFRKTPEFHEFLHFQKEGLQ